MLSKVPDRAAATHASSATSDRKWCPSSAIAVDRIRGILADLTDISANGVVSKGQAKRGAADARLSAEIDP